MKNAVLFSVSQYEGFKDQHYICFHTSSICMYQQGATLYNFLLLLSLLSITVKMSYLLIHPGLLDGGINVLDIKLPCRTHPHWLEPTIYQSETFSERSSTPSEGIGLEARSMVSVAVKISSQSAERNLKVRHSD